MAVIKREIETKIKIARERERDKEIRTGSIDIKKRPKKADWREKNRERGGDIPIPPATLEVCYTTRERCLALPPLVQNLECVERALTQSFSVFVHSVRPRYSWAGNAPNGTANNRHKVDD